MRVEEYVGQRIRDRRDELGMTQEEFGRRVGHFLGKPWSRSTVSVAENARRAFTAAELVAIANVLGTRAARLLTPPVDVEELEMPSGATMRAHPLGPDVGINDKYLSQMQDELAQILSTTGQTRRAAKVLEDKLTTLIAISETATMHSDRAGEGQQ
ncbi:MAG: helix-turn-helix domain-containing protein [Streptosporangiaceae bacterium]